MTDLLDFILQLDLDLARQARARTADLNYGKWFVKFSAAMNRYLRDRDDEQRAKVATAWSNMPPGLQRDVAAAARFAGCDNDLALLVGELPEPDPKPSIRQDPMC